MRILGIDPGLAIVGYSVLEIEEDSYELVSSGSIRTQKGAPDSQRLLEICEDMEYIIKKFQPDHASIKIRNKNPRIHTDSGKTNPNRLRPRNKRRGRSRRRADN